MFRVWATALTLCIAAQPVFGLDFFGATVYDRDVPASYMKVGIVGYHPIITDIEQYSVAAKAGLTRGDIILSVGKINILSTSELPSPLPEKITLTIFDKKARKTVTLTQPQPIPTAAPNMARAPQPHPLPKSMEGQPRKANKKKTSKKAQQEPPILFDNDYLVQRFGTAAPPDKTVPKANKSPRPVAPPPRQTPRPRALHYASTQCESGHWVSSVEQSGEIVILEDGSIWEIDLLDRIDTMLWLPTSDIVACDDKLINTDDKETASAVRLR